ncbi:MAG: cytidylate kinase-like family protein [Coriobacteriales bacterium]|jgi:cytidylate kinase|nr:cytidylate kinase-like family protein [Coriobacteriales bacterium]
MRPLITISRQYGSGGREIGERVATLLGYAYYDHELIKRAAQEGDFDEDLVREDGEGVFGRLSSLLSYAHTVVGKDEDTLPLPDRMFLVQSRIIKQIADEGPCVIIGHSADYLLADRPGLLNVYVHSDWDVRVARVMARNGLSEHDAVARIRKIDRQRSVFYEQHTGQKWGATESCHLSLSSSYFGIEGATALIVAVATGAGDAP